MTIVVQVEYLAYTQHFLVVTEGRSTMWQLTFYQSKERISTWHQHFTSHMSPCTPTHHPLCTRHLTLTPHHSTSHPHHTTPHLTLTPHHSTPHPHTTPLNTSPYTTALHISHVTLHIRTPPPPQLTLHPHTTPLHTSPCPSWLTSSAHGPRSP